MRIVYNLIPITEEYILTRRIETDIINTSSEIINSNDQEKRYQCLYSRELAKGGMPVIKGYQNAHLRAANLNTCRCQ